MTLSENEINDFFINIATNIQNKIDSCTDITDFLCPRIFKEFTFRQITYNETRIIINKLKNKKSFDIYNLNIIVIKRIKNEIIIPLTNLINQAIKDTFTFTYIKEGIYPEALKVSKVIPLPKVKNVNDLNELRPISVIPIISKFFEKALKEQIVAHFAHFEENFMFNAKQYGFRKGLWTVDAVMDLIDDIINGFEECMYTGATFCDLQRAFI